MIIVFGAINLDVNVRVRDFPKHGETVISPTYDMMSGGKGANQALAAARGGVKTALVGKVGDDAAANRILNGLRRNEVLTSGVATSDYAPTGMAFVVRDSKGENQITVALGANGDVRADQVPDEIFSQNNILLLQMELPSQENFALMERAKKFGVTIILNLAPAFHMPQKNLEMVDYLIVNEPEARMIAKETGIPDQQNLILVARALAAKGNLTCLVTLGSKGAVAVTSKGEGWRVPALDLPEVVDTTGAGDCFCGTFAAAIHAKLALGSAMRRASIAASLSCSKKGAQESYPYISEVEEILETFPQAQPV